MSERSLPDILLPYSELIRTCVIHSARFSAFWNFPKWDVSPACFHDSHMVAAAPREELGIWEGMGPQGVLGELEWSEEELRELLQRLHLQGLLFKSCPRCHSPQLLPIIRCTHFLSKPNNKKEETHTTRSFISLSPSLQISRFIFLDLKNTFEKMLFFSLEKQNAFEKLFYFLQKELLLDLEVTPEFVVNCSISRGCWPQDSLLMPELRSDLVSRGREGLGSTGGKREACGQGSLGLTSTYPLAHLFGENSINSIILQIFTKHLLCAKLFLEAGYSGFSDFSLAFQWAHKAHHHFKKQTCSHQN